MTHELVYDRYIDILTMVYKPTNITGGHHIVENREPLMHRGIVDILISLTNILEYLYV